MGASAGDVRKNCLALTLTSGSPRANAPIKPCMCETGSGHIPCHKRSSSRRDSGYKCLCLFTGRLEIHACSFNYESALFVVASSCAPSMHAVSECTHSKTGGHRILHVRCKRERRMSGRGHGASSSALRVD